MGVAFSIQTRSGVVLGFALTFTVIAGLVVSALAAGRKPHLRGLAQGVWIGLSVAVLLEGLCFLNLLTK
jgi:hypothetical protein